MDYSLENKKNVTREQEEQEINYTLINTFSRKAKREEKCGYGVNWLQKVIRYALAKLDNRLSQMYKISDEVIKFIEGTTKISEGNLQQEENV